LAPCTNNYGLGGDEDFTVTIAPATSCQNFTIDPVITNVNCFGQSNGSIALNPSGGATPYTVAWADGNTATTRTGLAKGIYQASITDANNCEVAIPLTPVLEPTALNVDTATVANNIVDVSASGGTAPYTYLWSNGDTSSNSSNLAAGTYSITVADAHGCDTTIQNIVIKQTTKGTIPPPPPPPVDSVKDSSVNIIVYPNPTSGIVYMQSQMQQTAYIQVVSEQGKIMEEGNYTINTSATSIDIAQFSAGIYFLKIVGDKSTRVVKIIKRDN
ncbi:MAG TPA: T9SS type A sorting domain-containing protein, partial [Bacteroidia bacterium]|nr:T9SS type A sorting domain-containing protein [Bacteroidia bacterium]